MSKTEFDVSQSTLLLEKYETELLWIISTP